MNDIIRGCFDHIKFDISPISANRFIEFCDTNGLDYIYLEIFKYYFRPSNYFDTMINLESLAICLENFLLILIRTNMTVDYNESGLKPVFKEFYKHENSKAWYQRVIKEWDEHYNYSLDKATADIMHQTFDKEKDINELIQSFLIAGKTRNSVAHSRTDLTFKNEHPLFYKEKIIGAIWFSWDYAENKLKLSTQS